MDKRTTDNAPDAASRDEADQLVRPEYDADRPPVRRNRQVRDQQPGAQKARGARQAGAATGGQRAPREGLSPAGEPDEHAAKTGFTSAFDVDAVRKAATSKRPKFLGGILRPRKDKGPRRPGFVRRKVTEWGDRLLGAATSGGFSKQDEVWEAGRTQQDYLWNTVGLTAWGMVFPLLTIVVTQLVGVEQAGMFSLAFVAGTLLMIIANYGVRTYQVSDRKQEHAFIDYQVNRWITCLLMMVVGYAFCTYRGYDAPMFTMTMWVFGYKMVDGLADVYEGRLQQVGKLYLAGISQTIRSVAAFVIFSVFLLISRDLAISSIALALAAGLTFVLFTLPLALLETPRSKPLSVASIGRLFAQCFPVFLALFLYAWIDNMPKFLMEGMLSYDNQLYFNALYFPAQSILLTVGFLYKPLLARMADTWNDLARRRRFDIFLIAAMLVIAAITLVGILLMRWIGIPAMSVLYGVDFERFRTISYIMIVAGGITGGIDFLYQVMTVMRRQGVVPKLYVITFVFSLIIPYGLIRMSGLRGAAIGYAIVMAILFVLLVLEYVGVRMNYRRHPEDDPAWREAAQARGVEVPQRAISAKELVSQDKASVPAPTLRRPRAQARQDARDGASASVPANAKQGRRGSASDQARKSRETQGAPAQQDAEDAH